MICISANTCTHSDRCTEVLIASSLLTPMHLFLDLEYFACNLRITLIAKFCMINIAFLQHQTQICCTGLCHYLLSAFCKVMQIHQCHCQCDSYYVCM